MPPVISPARKPAGAVRAITRFPLLFYRFRLGWLFGRRVLVLTHLGRVTGRRYRTPLEVIHEDRTARELFVMSGWGSRADWYRNLRAGSAATVQIGLRTHTPRTRLLDSDDGAAVISQYCRKHRMLARALARWGLAEPYTGSGEQLRRMAEVMPVVGLTVPGRPSGHDGQS